MTFGSEGKNGVRTSSLADCQEILDVFFDHGHSELDTARMYAEGTTEQVGITVCDLMCVQLQPRLLGVPRFYLSSTFKAHRSTPSKNIHI